MTRNNFIKNIPLETWIKVVGVLLIILYSFLTAIAYWTIGPRNLEFCLFLVFLLTAVGALMKKEWARRALVAANYVGVAYMLIDIIWISRGIDNLSLLFLVLFLCVIIFYQQPFVRIGFNGLPKPGVVHSWNILLIDDDKVLLKMMSRNFFQKGITLMTADTGERGLVMAQRQKPDLIILDVILPKMKGREVCQRLKEDSATKDIPIIFLTVQNSHDDIQAELEAGAVSHLTKPIDFPHLYEEIKKILGE